MSRFSARGVAAAVLVLVVAAVCVRLGFWQLDRLDQRRGRNALLAAAMEAPVLRLAGDSLRAAAADPEGFRYRRVRVQGEYDDPATSLLRGRARRGTPGVHLVTPLRLADSAVALLVDRGWVPAPDAMSVDPREYRSRGLLAVEGYLQPLPPGSDEDAASFTAELDHFSVDTYQRLNLDTLQVDYPVPLLPFYLERVSSDEEGTGSPIGAPPPVLDEGPHLGYAIQWFSFAAIAVIGFGVVALRGRRAGV